ncbi:MAG: UDP-N-acetylmuramate:L-alanyl-gamma-D-glutamyl-meso-diaminopimelate ligase [Desulfobulbaceae bacterium]|nr:UDP-N-acetylmuramate:L-alanyl-gamma-D-glutamyl-meso-diaminopimelate ligase [Desulfobulbaceae bacterium]
MSSPLPLDPRLNKVPGNVSHVHILGICGTGMAALAGMLKEKNIAVTGSDENVYPPMSDFLDSAGIPVLRGYSSENLSCNPDLVVVGNVIRASNPEVAAVARLGIPYVSMPQALAHFFLCDHTSLVVAGTHGKTTTSSLLASVLHHAGASPGFMIGGIVEAFSRNYALGGGEYFVVEGDEYDTAFFDKGSKFLHYRPDYAIITSVEFDHADIFSDLETIKRSFLKFVALVPEKGIIVACTDDPVVAEVVRHASCRVVSYGTGGNCEWQVRDFAPNGPSSSFTIVHDRRPYGTFTLPMPGIYNALNAASVISLLHQLGFDRETIGRGLASFQGVKRRQQIRGEVDDILVIDDFAHHPTAVSATVNALKDAWPGRRLVIVFEPRTNSSRRAVFQEKYARAFSGADLVLVREHIPLVNVPEDQQFSSRKLVEDLTAAGKSAHYFADTSDILGYLEENSRTGDAIAILSNGGFDNIHERLLARLRRRRHVTAGGRTA